MSLLQRIANETLPLVVHGEEVAGVEALLQGGLILATVEHAPDGWATARATVHQITPLGHLHLRVLPDLPWQ